MEKCFIIVKHFTLNSIILYIFDAILKQNLQKNISKRLILR
jgi:hypothetical protein